MPATSKRNQQVGGKENLVMLWCSGALILCQKRPKLHWGLAVICAALKPQLMHVHVKALHSFILVLEAYTYNILSPDKARGNFKWTYRKGCEGVGARSQSWWIVKEPTMTTTPCSSPTSLLCTGSGSFQLSCPPPDPERMPRRHRNFKLCTAKRKERRTVQALSILIFDLVFPPKCTAPSRSKRMGSSRMDGCKQQEGLGCMCGLMHWWYVSGLYPGKCMQGIACNFGKSDPGSCRVADRARKLTGCTGQ